jgi:hypothetical protein
MIIPFKQKFIHPGAEKKPLSKWRYFCFWTWDLFWFLKKNDL